MNDVIDPIFDAEEIARLANAFFRAPPDGASPLQATPPALGGFGASPGSVSVLAPPSGDQASSLVLPDLPNIAPAPAPAMPAAAAPQAGLPLSAPSDGVAPIAPRNIPVAGNDLSIVTEALAQQQARGGNVSDLNIAGPRADGPQDISQLDAPIRPEPRTKGPADPIVRESGYPMFDVASVRRDFPILQEKINGRPLVWLDNGATTQKPQAVIDRIADFYTRENSNIHRAAHTLAARSTDAYEKARKIAARFIGAPSADDIVFVRGATEAINLVAQSWGTQNVKAGDEIILSHLEHHANIVPWQTLARASGARLRIIPVDDDGQILMDAFEALLSDRTKIVAITHVSNALGTIVPIEAVIERAHAYGAKVLIDGAQSIAHAKVNVAALDADFFVFSGHKIFAPTGIGVLYGKQALLAAMRPWQGGGNMIADVQFDRTVFREPPARFEAGTGNLADAVGLGAALEYVERLGVERIAAYEHDLLDYATAQLRTIPGLRLFGTAPAKASVLSFTIKGTSPQEVGKALDRYGIAVRAGHHCAQPILRRFGVEETVRASIALYNTKDDIDCLVSALRQITANSGTLAS